MHPSEECPMGLQSIDDFVADYLRDRAAQAQLEGSKTSEEAAGAAQAQLQQASAGVDVTPAAVAGGVVQQFDAQDQDQGLHQHQLAAWQQQLIMQQQQQLALAQHAMFLQQQGVCMQAHPAVPVQHASSVPCPAPDAAMQAAVDVKPRAAGKRSSRSKSSSTGSAHTRQSGANQQQQEAEALFNGLGHTASATPGTAAFAGAAAAAAAANGSARPYSFTAGCLSGSLDSLVARQQQAPAQQQQQQQQPLTAAEPEEDEPDMRHLTVMQRYHARRKLALQRMEREVEQKVAQLALLEQENRQLKWRAHILENMLVDMDKQLEVMSASETPDASQYLALLGMSTSGSGGHITRTLHRMLEGACDVDVSTWTVQDCRSRWLSYLQQLRGLVQEAELAQAAYKATQAEGEQSSAATAGGRAQRPRRAAAAAADAVIKQEAAEVLGLAAVRPRAANNIPAPPPAPVLPPPNLSSSGSASNMAAAAAQPAAAAAAGGAEPMQGVQQASTDSGSMAERSTSGTSGSAPIGAAGVPAALLAQIEDLVLTNFYWLLSMMTSNPLLTYEFISTDLVEGSIPLPGPDDALWSAAVDRVQPTVEQLQEGATCLQVSRRCMSRVMDERAEIQAAMQEDAPLEHAEVKGWLSDNLAKHNHRDVLVERMRANVRKESVVRNLVGFYCINVFSLFQLAQVTLACSPWFAMAWRVCSCMEAKLNEQLAAQAGTAGQTQQARGGSGHNTRSAAQQRRQ